MNINTILVFDVEDTWYDDDIGEIIPRFFAETLTQYGLRAHFLLVGDRWRRIHERNEKALLRAMEPHDIGLHTDNALVGPMLSEMVADKDWDSGVAIAREYEERGLAVIEEVAGRPGCAISRHGHISGGPFSYEVAREKNLFYHYGYTPNPVGDVAPHWVAGALSSYSEGHNYITIHDYCYRNEEAYQTEIKKFRAHQERLQAEQVNYQLCFLGHPYCTMSENGHIINYHYRNGRVLKSAPETLAEVDRLNARRFPLSHLEDVKRRFHETAALLAGYRDKEIIRDVTMRELREVFGQRPRYMEWQITQAFAQKVVEADGIMPKPDFFTLGEYLIALVDAVLAYTAGEGLPRQWERCDVRAPRQEPPVGTETYWISGMDFVGAVKRLRNQWLTQGFLPASVLAWQSRNERLGLGHLLYGAALFFLRVQKESQIPPTLEFPLFCQRYPREMADMIDRQYANWRHDWHFREDLDPATVNRYARLQLWDTCSATK